MDNRNSANQVFSFHSDTISFKSIDGKDGKEYFVEGHISTGDLDLVKDIVTKACLDDMTNQFEDRVIKLDFEHESFRGKDDFESQLNKTKIPLGKAIETVRDEKGVKVTWKMNSTWNKFDDKSNVTMTFKDLWKNVEEGFYDAFSIAYVPVSTTQQNVKGVDARLLNKVNLFNVALTGNAINPNATMTNIMAKSLEWLKEKELKGYEKDGAHAHTTEEPLGIHNHPEIENILRKEVDWLNDRINSLREKVFESPNKQEETILKDKKGDDITMENKDDPANADVKNKPEGEGVKPDNKAKPKKTDDGKKPSKEDEEAGKETEKKALKIENDLVEIKAQLKDITDKNSELEKEVKDYKEIVEKARPGGLGAENAAEKDPGAEVKSVGPLDFIA